MFKSVTNRFIVILLLTLLAATAWSGSAYAINKYWIGSDGGNFTDNANWSTASGGGNNTTAPTSSDAAIFDSADTSNCSINSTSTVNGFTISAGYTGIITQAAGVTFTVNGTYSQADGTFNAGDSLLDLNGTINISAGTLTGSSGDIDFNCNSCTFTLSGTGTFTAPSTNLYVATHWTHSAGTFNHNNGTVIFDENNGEKNIDPSGGVETFYNLTFNSPGDGKRVVNSEYVVITNTLTFTDGYVYQTTAPTDGALQAQGNVVVGAAFDGGDATLGFTGTAAQNFTLTGAIDKFRGPIIVNKASETVTLQSDLTMQAGKAFTLKSGTLAQGTRTVIFNGAVNIQGGTYDGGSGTTDFNCNSCTFTFSGGIFSASTTNTNVATHWTHSAGTFTHNNGTVIFDDNNGEKNIDPSGGVETFYNLTFNSPGDGKRVVNSEYVVITNTLTFTDGYVYQTTAPTDGALQAQGNVVVGAAFDGGDATLGFTGTAAQNFTLTGAIDKFRGPIIVNKASETVTLQSDLTMQAGKAFTLKSGTLAQSTRTVIFNGAVNIQGGVYNGGSGTTDFNCNSCTFTFSGGTYTASTGNTYVATHWTHTVGGTFDPNGGTVIFDDGNGEKTIDVSTTETFYNLTFAGIDKKVADNDSIIVSNNLTLTDGYINQSVIPAAGTVQVQNTMSNGSGWDIGSSKIVINGAGTRSMTLTGTAANNFNKLVIDAPNATVNGPGSGTLTFASGYNFDLKQGTFTMGAGAVTINSVFTQSGGIFNASAATLILNNAINISAGTFNGSSGTIDFDCESCTFTLSGTGTLNAPSGPFYVATNWTHTAAGATFNNNNATVTFDEGNGEKTIDVNSTATFYNLTFAGIDKKVADNDSIIVSNNLTLTDGYINQSVIPAAGTIQVEGILSNASGWDIGSSKIVINGSGTRSITLTPTAANNFNKLVIDAPNATVNGPGSGTLTFASGYNFDLKQGTFTMGAGAVTINSVFTQSGGIFNASAATLILNNAINISAGTFNGSNGTIDFDCDSCTFTLSGTGTFNAPSGPFYVATNWTHTAAGATFNNNNATITFDEGNGDKTLDVNSTVTFYNMTINKPASTLVIANSDSVIASNNLTLTDGYLNQTTIPAAGTVQVQNTMSNASGWDVGTGSIVINGSGTRSMTLTGTAANNFNKLVIDAPNATVNGPGSGTLTFASGYTFDLKQGTFTMGAGAVTINSVFTQAGGTFNASAATLILNSTINISAGTFNGSNGTIDFDCDSCTFTLSGTGTLNAPSGPFYVATNWIHTAAGATFNNNNATITFDEANGDKTLDVNSTVTFYNMTINKGNNTVVVADNDSVIVSNALTLTDGYLNQTTIPAAGTLQVQNTMSNGSGWDVGSGKIVINGNGTRSITLTATIANNFNKLVIDAPNATVNGPGSGTLTFASGYNFDLKQGTFTMGAGAVTIHSVFTQSGGIFNASAATLILNSTINISAGTFNGSNGTIDFDCDSCTFTLSGTGTFTAPSGNLYVASHWTHTAAGATFNHNNGTVTLDEGNGDKTADVNVVETFNHLTLNHANTAQVIANNDRFLVLGNLTLTDGTLNQTTLGSPASVEVQGNITVASTFDSGTATFALTGGNTQNLNLTGATGLINSDITVNKSGGSVLLDSALVCDAANQDLFLQEGVFNLNGNSLTVNGTSGTIPVESGATLRLQGGESITANTNYPQFQSGSTLAYDGGGSYTMKNYAPHHLQILGAGTFTAPAAVVVAGDLTINTGVLALAGYSLSVSGGFYNNAILRLNGSETVTLTPDTNSGEFEFVGTGSYSALPLSSYYDLSFNGTGSWTLGASTTVAHDLFIDAGTFSLGGWTLTLGRDFNKTGTFTHANGTVTFNGTNQHVTGSSTFYRIVKVVSAADTMTWPAGTTNTITDTAVLQGASGQLLSLRSSGGSQANINFGGTRYISYSNIQDINNTNATVAKCVLGCVNNGGNTNWSFNTITTTQSQTWHFNDSNYTRDTSYVDLNVSGNSQARLIDQGGGTYRMPSKTISGSDFSKKVSVSVTNANGATLTNVQVQVTVPYDADMQADFDDIRFLDSDDSTVLNNYRASKTDSVTATFWVKIPSLPNGGKTIYLYYGNNSVSTTSSYDNVHDKDYLTLADGTTDSNLYGQWNYDEGSGTAVADSSGGSRNATMNNASWHTSDVAFSSGKSFLLSGDDKATTSIPINTTLTGDYALECWAIIDSSGAGWGWFFGETGGGVWLFGKQSGSATLHFNKDNLGSASSIGTYTTGAWHHFVLSHQKDSPNEFKIYIDGTLVGTYNNQNKSPTTTGNIQFGVRSIGEYLTGKLDEMRVYRRYLPIAEIQAHYNHRKYVATAPVASLGSEVPAGNADDVMIFPNSSNTIPNFKSLVSVSPTFGGGNQGTVEYQVGLDTNNDGVVNTWYYHDGYDWVTAADGTKRNTLSDLNTYLMGFSDEIGSGRVAIKSFLISNGTQQVNVDSVALTYTQVETNFALASQAQAESAGALNLAVNLDATTGSDVVIPYTVTGTAGGTDHNLVNGNVTITAGSTTANIPITITSDALDEVNETVIVTLGTPSTGNAILGSTAEHTLTINDDDATPTVGYTSTTSDGFEVTTSVNLAVTLSAASGQTITVNYAATGGTATGAGTDYTLNNGTLTFNPGDTSKNVPITVVNDTLDEVNETVVVTLSAPANATLATSTHTYTIKDDDDAPTISINDRTVTETEGSVTATFTVSLSAASSQTITVDRVTANGSAVGGSDFTALSNATITFNPNDTTKTVDVTVLGDTLDEDNETFTLNLSNATNATISDNSGTGTINDNDAMPSLTLTSSAQTLAESGGTASLTAELSVVSGRTVSVPYTVTGTATGGGTDFVLASGTLSISAGSTSGSLSPSIMNDSIDETDETLIVTLGSPTNATNGATLQHTLTITDDDTAGITLTESGGSVVLTEGSVTDTYTVKLNSAPTADVIIAATPNAQVQVSPASLTFTSINWNTPQTVTVTAVDDLSDESSLHTGVITHASTSVDVLYNAMAVVSVTPSITDNDTAGVSIAETSGATTLSENAGTDAYSVVLTTQPAANVTIALTLNNTQVSLSPASLIFTSSNWNVAQNIVITGIDDDRVEGVHSTLITHAATSTDPFYNALAIGSVTASLTDDDAPGVTILESSGSTVVTEGGATDTYEITLMSEPLGDVTVTLGHDTQLDVTPASVTFTTANWDVPQIVTVSAANDSRDEEFLNSSITHAITASADANYPTTLSIANVIVAITDNETAGITLTESEGTTTVSETGETDSYTVALNSEPTADVTVTLNTTGQTVTTPASLVFSITNWNLPQTVMVSALEDSTTEGDHTDTIAHAMTSDDEIYDGLAAASVTVNIADGESEVDGEAPGSVCTGDACVQGDVLDGIVIAANGDSTVVLTTSNDCNSRSCNQISFGDGNLLYTATTDSVMALFVGDTLLIGDPAYDDDRGMVLSLPSSLSNQTIDVTTVLDNAPDGVGIAIGTQDGDLFGADITTGDSDCDDASEIWILATGTTFGTVYIVDETLEIVGLVIGAAENPIVSIESAAMSDSCGDDMLTGDGTDASLSQSRFAITANQNVVTGADIATGFAGIVAEEQKATVFNFGNNEADFNLVGFNNITHADVGDVDGDGVADLVTADAGDGKLEIFLGTDTLLSVGSSVSSDQVIACAESATLTSLLVTDVNGDGADDILAGFAGAAGGRGRVYVLSGRQNWAGTSNFNDAKSYTGAPQSSLGRWLVVGAAGGDSATLYSSLGESGSVALSVTGLMDAGSTPTAGSALGPGGTGCSLTASKNDSRSANGMGILLATVVLILFFVRHQRDFHPARHTIKR